MSEIEVPLLTNDEFASAEEHENFSSVLVQYELIREHEQILEAMSVMDAMRFLISAYRHCRDLDRVSTPRSQYSAALDIKARTSRLVALKISQELGVEGHHAVSQLFEEVDKYDGLTG